MGQDTGQIRQDIEETRGRMGETVEALGYKADVPGRAKEAVSGRVESVKSKISGATPDSGEVKQGAYRAKGMAQENPLGLALGAVAVGFVGGLLIPSTRVEDERSDPWPTRSRRRRRRPARRPWTEPGTWAAKPPTAPRRPLRRPDVSMPTAKDSAQQKAQETRDQASATT